MRVVICDDNSADLQCIESCLQGVCAENKLEVDMEKFTTGAECEQYLRHNKADLLIIDIYLGDENGTDLALRLRKAGMDCKLVFLTSSNEFACESFRAGASYYLLKPCTNEKLQEALERCELLAEQQIVEFDTGKNILKLDISKLMMIEVKNRVCDIYMTGGEINAVCPFYIFSERLTSPEFLIVNRGLIVNMNYIESVTDSRFILKNGLSALIKSRGFKEIHEQYLNWLFENM